MALSQIDKSDGTLERVVGEDPCNTLAETIESSIAGNNISQLEALLDLLGPHDLRDDQDDLARPRVEPSNTVVVEMARALTEMVDSFFDGHGWIVHEAIRDDRLNTLAH